MDGQGLLDTPAELCCPLTRTLLREPVLTTAGHVYEKAAILEHLKLHDTDPISGEPISGSVLTDVQYLRKRVQAYRDVAISTCITLACSEDCKEPVRYLRRALQLSAGGRQAAPGLSDEFAAYVRTHQSNVYDVYALQIFARGLQNDGYPHLAAQVVTKLLHLGEDKAQQAAIVKQWLSLHAETAAGDGCEAAQLANFVRTHRLLTWSQSLDIMSEAGVSLSLVAQACRHLLAGNTPPGQQQEQHALFLRYADLSLRRAEQQLLDLQESSAVPDLHLPAEPLVLSCNESSSSARSGRSSISHRAAYKCRTRQRVVLSRCLTWVAVGCILEAIASPSRLLLMGSQAAVVAVVAMHH